MGGGGSALTLDRVRDAVLIWASMAWWGSSGAGQRESYRVLLEEMGNHVSEGFFRPYVGHPEQEIWGMLRRAGYRFGLSREELTAHRQHVFLSLALAELQPTWLVRDLALASAGAATRQVVVSNGNPDVIRPLLESWDLPDCSRSRTSSRRAARRRASSLYGPPGEPSPSRTMSGSQLWLRRRRAGASSSITP